MFTAVLTKGQMLGISTVVGLIGVLLACYRPTSNELRAEASLDLEYGLVQIENFSNITTHTGVDIIFVHGLGANPNTTWSARTPGDTSENPSRVYWTSDFLPSDLPPLVIHTVRAFHWNHDSAVWKNAPSGRTGDLALILLADLRTMLRDSGAGLDRKLVFVAHSLGGLIVKQALEEAWDHKQFGEIAKKASGVLFLGTPHDGARWAWVGCLFARLWQFFGFDTNSDIVCDLQTSSTALGDLQRRFQKHYGRHLRIVNFHERRSAKQNLGPWTLPYLVVDKPSAIYDGDGALVINRGLSGDHYNLNKFPRRNADYRAVLAELLEFLPVPQVQTMIVPEDLVRNFVPRPLLLDSADAILSRCQNKSDKTCAVLFHGLGGSGKTQLARYAVEKWKSRYHTILWVDCRSSSSVIESFQYFASLLKVPTQPESMLNPSILRSQVIKSVNERLLQNHIPDTRWLLVLDDVGNLSESDVKAMLPLTTSVHLLLTSRITVACFLVSASCDELEIGNMETTEASSLVLRNLGIGVDDAQDTELQLSLQISQLVDSFAMAVQLIGAYIAQQRGSDHVSNMLRYIQDFRKRESRSNLLRLRPTISGDYPHTVWTVWDKTMEDIRMKNPDFHVEQVLQLLSCFDHVMVQDSIFEYMASGMTTMVPYLHGSIPELPSWLARLFVMESGVWDDFAFRQAVQLLAQYSLVKRTFSGRSGTSMHALVQWRAQQDVDNHSWHDWLLTLCAAACHASFQRDDDDQIRGFLMTQILALRQSHAVSECYKDQRLFDAFAQTTLGTLFQQEGQYILSFRLRQQAYERYYMHLGCDSLEAHLAYASMGQSLHSIGAWHQAAVVLELALQNLNATLGDQDHRTTATIYELATTYSDLGDLVNATKLATGLYETRLKISRENDPSTLPSMGLLGFLLTKQGQFEKGIELLARVVEWSKDLFPDAHLTRLTFKANLATGYLEANRPQDAQRLYEEVLDISKDIVSSGHPFSLKVSSNLAYSFLDQKQFDRAEEIFRKVLQLRIYYLGCCSPDTLDTRAALAGIANGRGNMTQARHLMNETAQLAFVALGPGHPSTIKFQSQLLLWQHDPLESSMYRFIQRLYDIVSHCVALIWTSR